MNYLNKIKKAAKYIKNSFKIKYIDAAVILGSGLTNPGLINEPYQLPYKKVPYFPSGNVSGHFNSIIFKKIKDKKVLFFLGRVHYYEGYFPEEVIFPVRIIKELGAKNLILTNAAGGLNIKLKTGSLMIIKDHINLTGTNPLIGRNLDEHGTRFVSMKECYSPSLINKLIKISAEKLFQGTYVGVSGPAYETKAEINFFKIIGGDAVGMSTVMEAIAASHCGIQTAGISCITNNLNNSEKVDHKEVLDTADKTNNKLHDIIIKLIKAL